MNVLCVGGAPSSGTTLVADLLDSVPGAACEPEAYLFCFDAAYGWSPEFQREAVARRLFPTGAACFPRKAFGAYVAGRTCRWMPTTAFLTLAEG